MDLIDTHCHINFADKFPDVALTLAQANEAGVRRVMAIGVDTASSEAAVALAEEYEGVFAVVGCHPNYSANFREDDIHRYAEWLARPKVVALGEIGLDFHWDYATKEQQIVALHAQLALACDVRKPIVFHCRKADDDLLAILESSPRMPYLFHCFSGNAEHARRATDLDAYFGVDGPITYKNAADLRAIVACLPKDRIVIETDAPFMPPEPHRGKTNQPAWVALVNAALASLWGIAIEDAARITTENAERFFRLSQS